MTFLEKKGEDLQDQLYSNTKRIQELFKKIKDLSSTQLSQEVTRQLAEFQKKVSDPSFGLNPDSQENCCLDRNGKEISVSDLVEAEDDSSGASIIGRVIQTGENNIALLRLCNNQRVIGRFGRNLNRIEEREG